MTSSRRTSLAALAAAAVLAGGALTVLPAAADAPTEWVGAGSLTLSPSAGRVSTDSGLTQSLATSGTCDLKTTGKDLLRFSGAIGNTTKKVGYRQGSIGVQELLTSYCNLVDTYSLTGPETLKLTLGGGLVSFVDRPLLANRASLALTVSSLNKVKAQVDATTYLGGVANGTFTLKQGAGSCNVADGGVCTLTVGNGTQRFDTVALKASKGLFSLRADSKFDLVAEVDKELDCTDNTLTEGDVTLTYLGNANGSACESFGVVLTAGDEEVRFLKPQDPTDPTTAQFIVDVTWHAENSGAPDASLPGVTIDFEAGPTNVTDLAFCPAFLYDAAGVLVGIQNPADLGNLPPNSEFDYEPALAGTQFACLGEPRNADVTASSLDIQDRVYVLGDAKMRLG